MTTVPLVLLGNHAYEAFLKSQGIRHIKIKPRTPKSNGMVERFNRTLLEEFYQIVMIKRFITYYNFKRTNQAYRLKGKIL